MTPPHHLNMSTVPILDHGMKNADVTVGMAILSCCFLVGITGNSLVIWIYTYVIKEGNIRLIAIAMAVFDLTMSVIVVPGNIILLVLDHRNLLTDSRACKFLLGMQMYLLGASQWMVAVLCYERLFKLWRPCHLVLQEKARAKRHILTAVVFAALLAAPQVLMSGLTVKRYRTKSAEEKHDAMCFLEEDYLDGPLPRLYYIVVCTFLVGVVCFVTGTHIHIGVIVGYFKTAEFFHGDVSMVPRSPSRADSEREVPEENAPAYDLNDMSDVDTLARCCSRGQGPCCGRPRCTSTQQPVIRVDPATQQRISVLTQCTVEARVNDLAPLGRPPPRREEVSTGSWSERRKGSFQRTLSMIPLRSLGHGSLLQIDHGKHGTTLAPPTPKPSPCQPSKSFPSSHRTETDLPRRQEPEADDRERPTGNASKPSISHCPSLPSLPEGEVLQVSSNDALQMRLAREESFRRLEEKLFQGYSDLSLRYMAKLPTSPLPQANGRRRDSLESELQSLASSAFICVLGRLVMFVAISLLPYAIMMVWVTATPQNTDYFISEGCSKTLSIVSLRSIFVASAFNPYFYFLTEVRVRKKVGYFCRQHFPIVDSRAWNTLSSSRTSPQNQPLQRNHSAPSMKSLTVNKTQRNHDITQSPFTSKGVSSFEVLRIEESHPAPLAPGTTGH